MLKVGDKIPDIQMQGALGGEIKPFNLANYRGKNLVLIFYPFAFTPN